MSPRHEPSAEAGFTLVEIMIVLVMIAVLASIALSAAMHAFDTSRLGRTVANMRGTSDAILKYQTDTSSLPAGGLQPVSSIAATISPSGGRIPLVDGWDHPIYYEPYTTAQGLPTFRLYSYGKDGASDGVVTGTWVDFFTDTVMEGGSFIQTRW
jgi:general secretion pathway protein G